MLKSTQAADEPVGDGSHRRTGGETDEPAGSGSHRRTGGETDGGRPELAFAVGGHVPAQVVRPDTVAETSQVLAEANQKGVAIVPWGGGNNQALGNMPTRYELALDMRGLDQVVDHQPGDLTVTVGAGLTLAALQDVLAVHGQYLPLEAADPTTSTIGGLLAAGVSGPIRFSCGTARDFTLWTETVSADGTVVHGGAKVVKNVAGYDLPKLYLGSLGSVGILTAACFRVWPLPASRRTVVLAFAEASGLQPALASLQAGGLAPSLIAVVRGEARWGHPFDLGRWVLAIGADGPEAATAWQVARCLALGRDQGAVDTAVLDGASSVAVRQALMTHRATGVVRLKLAVLPMQIPSLLEWLDHLPQAEAMTVSADAGNGIVRCAFGGTESAAAIAWRAAATRAADLGGHWVLESCPTAWKVAGLDVWGEERGDRFLMRRLKAALDPTGTLCPGRFVGG